MPDLRAAAFAAVALLLLLLACSSSRIGAPAHLADTYNPCPATGAPCAILPLGDSITFGQRSTSHGGYRAPLFQLAQAGGKKLTFVGGLQDGPATLDGVAFPAQHEGYPGYTIGGDGSDYPSIAPFAADRVASYKPNIVLLMIGTNDMTLQLDLPNAPKRLGALIDKILVTDPRVLLIVAQIVPTRINAENALAKAYNAEIPALVAAAAAGKHVVLVDMYSAFASDAHYKTSLLADDVHPNDRGYALMARVWYAALAPLLH